METTDDYVSLLTVSQAEDDEFDEPVWSEARKVHDWRNYVPPVVMDSWHMLDSLGKAAVYLTAEAVADSEEWD